MPLQNWIYNLEQQRGVTFLRVALAILTFLAMALLYDLVELKNFSHAEAMDTAQLARNLSRGDGYTTQFVRPISIHALEVRAIEQKTRTNDLARLTTPHPDLSNAPFYPVILAGMMKILPVDFAIHDKQRFKRHSADVAISIFNQLLLLGVAFLVHALGRRLFDSQVGWLAAILVVLSEPFWQYASAGLSMPLLQILFLGLILGLITFQQTTEQEDRPTSRLLLLAAMLGSLVGLLTLTRYALGWLMVPLAISLWVMSPNRKFLTLLVALVGFGVFLGPWLARNHSVSGNLFGVAGCAIYETPSALEGTALQRSLIPSTGEVEFIDLYRKTSHNLIRILREDLPTLGGNWISAFFLVGLFLPFANALRNRTRFFTLGSLVLLVLLQALLQAKPPVGPSEVSPQNLVLVIAPVIFVFGAAFLASLKESISRPTPSGGALVTTLLVLIFAAPMILRLLPPRQDPRAYPPYLPPRIQSFCEWLDPSELVLSDQPWAVAWYGDRKSIWLTLHLYDEEGLEDFFAIDSYRAAISSVYLSHITLDQPYFSQLRKAPAGSWQEFALQSFENQKLPGGFPLRHTPIEFLATGDLFVTDRTRWKLPPEEPEESESPETKPGEDDPEATAVTPPPAP